MQIETFSNLITSYEISFNSIWLYLSYSIAFESGGLFCCFVILWYDLSFNFSFISSLYFEYPKLIPEGALCGYPSIIPSTRDPKASHFWFNSFWKIIMFCILIFASSLYFLNSSSSSSLNPRKFKSIILLIFSISLFVDSIKQFNAWVISFIILCNCKWVLESTCVFGSFFFLKFCSMILCRLSFACWVEVLCVFLLDHQFYLCELLPTFGSGVYYSIVIA